MSLKRLFHTISLVLLLSPGVYAQDIWQSPDSWQAKMDLLTSGAAASVISHLVCYGEQSSREAAQFSHQRLSSAVQVLGNQGPGAAVVAEYAEDSYNMKIKAIWAANEGIPCSGLIRLRHLAVGAGFMGVQ